MSITALDQFRAKLATDVALQKACMDSMSAGKQDEVIALGRSLGFEFSAEDVQQRMADAELSEIELELVSAGAIVHCDSGNGSM